MTKKPKMHGNPSEIERLIRYLNQDLAVLSKAVATQQAEELAARRRFMNQDLSHLKIVSMEPCGDELKITQRDVDFLSWLRVMLATILERDPPTSALRHLIYGVNRRTHNRPMYRTWDLYLPREDTNLHLGGHSWWLETINTERDFTTHLCYLIMRVLELDQLRLMGICRTCDNFFQKKRNWQKDCGKDCKKKYDNRSSNTRKITRKDSQVLALLKQDITKLLNEGRFIKKLGRNPSECCRNRDRLLNDLVAAKSIGELWSATGHFRAIIDAELWARTLPKTG